MKGSVVRKCTRTRSGTHVCTSRCTRWFVVVEAPRDPLTGKRKRQWSRGFPTRREAEEERTEAVRRIRRGRPRRPVGHRRPWRAARGGQ